MPESAESALPEGAVERGLDLVNPGDRRQVFVVGVLVALAVFSFGAWATVNSRGEAFVDHEIEVKAAPTLEQHGKAIEELQADRKKETDDIAGIRADLAAIRQAIQDLKERR